MFTRINWLLYEQHFKDLLQEAGQARLARRALSARPVHQMKKKTMPDVEIPCCDPAGIAGNTSEGC